MFKSSWVYAALIGVGFCISGCAPSLIGNLPREANRMLPQSYGAAENPPQATSAAQKKWLEIFESPELRDIIETALKNNQELNVRVQEVIIAQAEISARQGEVLPKVGVGLGAGLEKVGKDTSQGRADEANGVPENLGNFAFGLTGSWEVDIWKKLRNAVKAADLRYLASIEARNFLITQIVAEIARSYYELIAVDNMLEILQRNIDIQINVLEIVRLEKLAARVTELAVQRFEAEVLKYKSRRFIFEQEKIQLENRINFLAGRFPQPIQRNSAALKAPVQNDIVAGLPSELLENRPDVRQAELELAAAELDVKVAKAAFYPSLSIDAGVGYRAFNIEHLVTTPASLIYNIAGNLTAPLLNRNAITAQYRSSNAKQIQAVFNFERTLLQAYTDVLNQIAKIENLQKSFEMQSRQVDLLTRSVEISTMLFMSAREDYIEVLLTRRDSLEAQMELIETKKRQFLAKVNIYQALGGGWRPGA